MGRHCGLADGNEAIWVSGGDSPAAEVRGDVAWYAIHAAAWNYDGARFRSKVIVPMRV